MQPTEPTPPTNKSHIHLDLRIVVLILLAVIAGLLLLWKPWDRTTSDRTIEVTGTATLKATPDEYIFSPTYEFNNADKTKALDALTAKSDQIVAELKKLGVADSKIKTNAADYQSGGYFPPISPDGSSNTYTLSLSVTVDSKDLAQKVQDYLITTAPSGQVTPQPAFSTAKQKQLESQARAEAEKDARTKADQSAKNIGFKIGKVKTVSEYSGFGGPVPLQGGALSSDESDSSTQLTIQPGENELTYSISVTYFIK